jgi:hypothetical protein
LNLSRGVDEALVRLLNTTSTRAGSVDAVRKCSESSRRRAAPRSPPCEPPSRNSWNAWIPKLEERFERAGKRGVFGVQNKGKYWDMYTEMYPGLAQRPADGFPHLFTETFAKAYEAKLRTLVPPRRTTFGADRGDPIEPAMARPSAIYNRFPSCLSVAGLPCGFWSLRTMTSLPMQSHAD